MNPIILCLLLSVLCLTACGDDPGEAEASKPEANEKVVDLTMAPAVAVQSLPDPCALLSAEVAAELLGLVEVTRKHLQSERSVARICSYSDASGASEKMLLLSLKMFAPEAMSSATDSREELISKASRLAEGMAPTSVRDDVGNISFLFDQGGATRLQVLTGLGKPAGAAGAAAELQLGYAIKLPEVTPAQREEMLVRLARGHLAAMTSSVQ